MGLGGMWGGWGGWGLRLWRGCDRNICGVLVGLWLGRSGVGGGFAARQAQPPSSFARLALFMRPKVHVACERVAVQPLAPLHAWLHVGHLGITVLWGSARTLLERRPGAARALLERRSGTRGRRRSRRRSGRAARPPLGRRSFTRRSASPWLPMQDASRQRASNLAERIAAPRSVGM